ncbi:hypothetical protein [Catellatospora coxensis]|uniref:SH3 domain-containing protein n=1 Tax=Catellatospora coxensis TaxID=310354 RepID=A0A8J3L2Y5_9ACTN|nr:hypothetical protein [Catellatospora coxensis]GIG06730.1 hypothetical protein Cco03nite_34300 [Catellatospora coxensis]
MASTSARLRMFAGATALVLTLSAADCDGGQGFGGGDSGGQEHVAASPAEPGCRQPGPITRDLLPTFGAEQTTTIHNPCLQFVGLIANVRTVIPAEQLQRVDEFSRGLGTLVDRVAKVADAVECGYETDRLAIAIYQNNEFRYSVGVVAVVSGNLQALVEGAACYLSKQLTLGFSNGFLNGSQRPRPDFCFDAVTRTRKGQRYTVLWMGSTDFMCMDLTGQLKPGRPEGDGVTATVKADPRVIVRSGPTTHAAIVGRADAGQVGVVDCYIEGQQVSGRRGSSRLWDHTTVGDVTGYIADSWLDTGGDITQKVPRCPLA